MTDACTYCGSDVLVHDPVFVGELVDGERTRVSQFCNYACLVAHVDDAGLTTGDRCRIDR